MGKKPDMKFFTIKSYKAWYRDGVSEPSLSAFMEHAEYLQQQRGVMPDSLHKLASTGDIADSLIASIIDDRKNDKLILRLRSGSIPDGYFSLEMTYSGLHISPEDKEALIRIARETKSVRFCGNDLVVYEVELCGDSLIEHRLMFHGPIIITIRCESLKWKRRPLKSRRLPPYANRVKIVS